jgi:hypothetical protein
MNVRTETSRLRARSVRSAASNALPRTRGTTADPVCAMRLHDTVVTGAGELAPPPPASGRMRARTVTARWTLATPHPVNFSARPAD